MSRPYSDRYLSDAIRVAAPPSGLSSGKAPITRPGAFGVPICADVVEAMTGGSVSTSQTDLGSGVTRTATRYEVYTAVDPMVEVGRVVQQVRPGTDPPAVIRTLRCEGTASLQGLRYRFSATEY